VELAQVLDRLKTPVAVSDDDRRIAYQNEAHRRLFGQARGLACHAVFRGETQPCAHCPGGLGEETPPEGGVGPLAGQGSRCFVLEDDWVGHEVSQQPACAEQVSGFLGQFFESAGVAVFLEHLDGTILAMNREAERLYGYDRGQWIGRSILHLIPETARSLLPRVVRDLEEQGAFRLETDQRRADGTLFRAQVEGVRLERPEGLALVTVRDITSEARERGVLESRSREFEQLLYSVAHDLRSPLVGIKGYAGLIDRTLSGGDAKIREYVRTVLRQTERLESLVDDLLQLARIGRSEEFAMDLDVAGSARDAWQDLCDATEATGATLTLAGHLPAVRMAAVRLTQVFANLFSNALKYRREGVEPRVEVSTAAPAPESGAQAGVERVCLRVRDNGVGVAPEEREEIFELFRQGTRVHREGAGLGLAIVRRIVESCGGRIWVEPTEGPGTSFCFTLPRAGEDQ
jgi:PAS domain S-box-containing protein